MNKTLPSFNINTYDETVVVNAVLELMKNKTMWEDTATRLLRILACKVPKEDICKLPTIANHLSRIIRNNVNVLADHGVIAGKTHSGKRSIRFVKTPSTVKSTEIIMPTNTKKENIMETKTCKHTLKVEVLTAIKEMGPISIADIAMVTLLSTDSVRSTISMLVRQGWAVASKSAGKGTRGTKLYYWDNTPKKPAAVVKPKTKAEPAPEPTPEVKPKTTSRREVLDIVNRAYYLMLAFRKLDVDMLMDHFELDEATAEEVLISMLTKYKNNVRADITARPVS